MLGQVVLPSEPQLAVGAHVVLALAVDVPDVGVQVGVGGELLVAVQTGKRFYVGMSLEVVLEAGNGGELAVAQRAEQAVARRGGCAV